MNRFLLPILLVGFVVIALGVGGFAFVYYYTMDQPIDTPKDGPKATPISYARLEQILHELNQHENDPAQLKKTREKAAAEIPHIIACFEIDDEDLRVHAAETLSKIGPKAVEPLRPVLKDKNAKVRFWAVQTLALLKEDAAAAAPDLLVCLKDENADVRYKAAYALGRTGVKSDAVIEGLIGALSDPEESVTQTASETLENIGTPSKDSLPMLVELANKGPTPAAKATALKLLGRLGEPALPALKDLLVKANPLDRLTIVQAIAELGPKARPVLPVLETIMIKNRFWDDDEQWLGIFKKCKADGAKGLANVLKTLHDPKAPDFAPNDGRSIVLLKALGDMGPQAKVAVPLLIELLNERDALRPQILDTLGGIGPAAKDAIPAVEALTKEPALANAARVCLRRMGVFGDKK